MSIFIGTNGDDDIFAYSDKFAILVGDRGNDLLAYLGPGHASIFGGADDDRIYGAHRGDWLAGGLGNDFVNGLDGADYIMGNDGDDTLIGAAGADILKGGHGADVIFGGPGKDEMWGGRGADTFVIDLTGNSHMNFVHDFRGGEGDAFMFLAHPPEFRIFAALDKGELSAGAFHVGNRAEDADDRIIYNRETGALWFDPDGTGGDIQVRVAKLANRAALDEGDFFIA